MRPLVVLQLGFHLSLLPKFDNPEQHSEPCGLEEDMDLVLEEMRVADEVRIRRQFRSYSGRQEDLQVGDYVYEVVLPSIKNSRKLVIKWSGPLIINRFVNNRMIEIKEIRVKKLRVYMAHCTKLSLAKCNGVKDLNPNFFLPRILLKDAGQMEDALSTVVLSAKVFTDQVKDEFCPTTHPQVGTSLSGSTMSSTVQARPEKKTSQESTCSEKTV